MIKALVFASNGKMGQKVRESIAKTEGIEMLCGVDHVTTGKEDYPYYDSLDKVTETPDVIIDFSYHTLIGSLLDFALKKNCPVVIATTGFTADEMNLIEQASKKIPLFLSYNMSMGIALLVDFAKKTAECFPDADIEIVETHHNRKVDAPSGTAIMLANSIKEARPEANFVFGRSGECKRKKEDIGIHALRMANIVGEHSVFVTTDSQQIELKHTAYDRSLFSDGAVWVAKQIVGKPCGLYNMKDLI